MKGLTVRSAVAVLILSISAWGQGSTASLRGTVFDPQHAIVAGASVTLSNPNTGFSQSTETDSRGVYQFLQIPPGTYTLTVSQAGFATIQQEGLQLLVNLPATSDVTLQIKGEIAVIEVTGNTLQVNTQDATLGNAFGTKQIAALPFEGRDPTQILSLQPGVTFVGTNVDQNNDSRGGSVSGARSDQTNITLDGIDDNDQVKGYAFQGALRSTLDSLQEFRVTTSSANADQGRSSGAQVSLITKSGTNNFHGSVYEYNRNNVGLANDWFNKQAQLQSGLSNRPGQLIRNTFGATFGGPIVRDRIFFFLAYEGQRTRENAQVTHVVPSDNLRRGSMSYDCSGDPACPSGGTETLTQQNLATMDPNCTSNNTCPLGPGANPAVMALFQQYPHPNSSAVGDGLNFQGFTFPASTPGRLNTYIARFDFNVTQKHHVFVRGGMVGDNNGAGPQFPGQPQSLIALNNSKGFIVGYTATVRPNLINNFHYGFIRQGGDTSGQISHDYIVFGNGPDALNAQTFTTNSNVPVHNLTDDVESVKGKHTFAFGGNLRIITSNRASNANSFSYARSYNLWLNPTAFIAGTGSSLDPGAFGFPAVNSSFQTGWDWPVMALTGLLDSSFSNYNITKDGNSQQPGTPALRHFRAHEFEMYAQDSWRVTPHLTLTYGVRYTLLQPPYETTGTQVSPSVSLESFLRTRGADMAQGIPYNPPVSYILSGQANGKAPYWNWDYKDFAPRVAFAWSPSADGGLLKSLLGGASKTSIRGGYGIYYDHFGQGIVDSFDRNGSFGLTTSIPNPIGQFTIDNSPRFSSVNTIPSILIQQAPTGPFPKPAPSGLPDGVANSWGVDDKMKTPYSHVFDFSISRELRANFVVDVAYIGRLGRRLLQEQDMAMPLNLVDKQSGMDYFTAATLLSKAGAAATPIQNLAPIPYWEDMFPGAAGVYDAADFGQCTPGNATLPPGFNPTATQAMYSSYVCALHNETLPLIFADVPGELGLGPNPCFPACSKLGPYAYFNPQFASLYSWRGAGSSSYHALQVTIRHGMSHGLQWDFNYTYSKSIDIGSNAERVNEVDAYYQADQIINSWSPAQLRGPSDFDTTHQFNTNWVYELPFGRGKAFAARSGHWVNAVVGGWQWSVLARWTSGFPTTIETFTSFPTNWFLPSTAILNGPKPKTGAYIVNGNPNLFRDPLAAQGDFRYSLPGESGQRNELRGPGFFGIDSGLSKTWSITESQNLRFSWEVFNVTNAVRFDVAPLPQSTGQLDVASSVFGTFTSTLTKPRLMQFALRYTF
jgi:Carboxypeptidase regulatory-like domain/TonB dependent receptor